MTVLEPTVDDEPPRGDAITPYDEAHLLLYLRLLDAESEGADWREVARIVLHRDPDADPERSHACWESHVRRARWIAGIRYNEWLARKVGGE